MKPLPLVNKQALGRTFTVPGSRPGNRPVLGQMGPTIGSDELAYREAVKNLAGAKKAYPRLLALLGQDGADAVLKEATAAVEKAQAEYLKSVPQK